MYDVIPLAISEPASARHFAWCTSWCKAQRQSTYGNPGYYQINSTHDASGLGSSLSQNECPAAIDSDLSFETLSKVASVVNQKRTTGTLVTTPPDPHDRYIQAIKDIRGIAAQCAQRWPSKRKTSESSI